MTTDSRLRYRHNRLPEPSYELEETALLIIDMQYGDAHRDYGLIKRMRDRGDADIAEPYIGRVESLVVPNIQRLQQTCREVGVEIVHVGIQSLTKDGRDRSLEHKRLGIHNAPDSREAEFLREIAPLGDEVVITKTCGGVFNGTNIDYVLRNLGIQNLIVVGVVTSGCVELAVRDASDRSYSVVLVEDATATWNNEMQASAVRAMGEIYAKVRSTDEVIAAIKSVRVAAV